ncbi:tetratricopeptide repeat protein [Wukongibacter baidiensis]|uniref:tetratricopeptide repeat protein n=1 Tax=Wukongibacter baidiensis TaxID=1723361 RepID=UPI003D7FA951
MKKFNLSHIKILSPEEQVEKKVIERFGDIDSFAKQINMDTESVYQNLNKIELGSKLFVDELCEVLNMKVNELIKSNKEQIKYMVQSTSDNLQSYRDDEDIHLLRAIKGLCIDNNLEEEALVMRRNIAMYYFYTGIPNRGIDFMKNTISLTKNLKLLIKWKSELGLMHYLRCNYKKSRKIHEEVEELLNKANGVNDSTIYLHYYRYGIVEHKITNYLLAEKLFVKSLEYAKSSIDKGDSIVNIGLAYKWRGKYNKAIEYYNKALDIFEKDLDKAAAYNNIAEAYKCLGKYDRALIYIQKAFECIGKSNITRLFLYYETYSQIQILRGDYEKAIKKLQELIKGIEDNFVHNQTKMKAIKTLIDHCIKDNNVSMLNHIRDFIIDLVEKEPEKHEKYLNNLYGFIGGIRLYTN